MSLYISHRLLRARDWQDRPQLGYLRDWWRSGQGGVCALVGIGGAGKTAIADRFVRSLPGLLPGDDVPKDDTLTPPDGLFVFSFYDAPNPDAFFAALSDWLGDENATSYEASLRLLRGRTRVFLVLDGLEKIQDTGERGGYLGQITDGRLRDLVLRVADGWLPGVPMLITTRFRLFDAMAERSPLFWQIPVEELTLDAAVALLRQRGVRGSDNELAVLARDQGLHALSVDLAGGYVARFLNGKASRWTSDAVASADAGLDPAVAALREQERKLGRLTERYGEALRERDPAVLALLQRVCLFRLGVEAAVLASVFTGEGKESVAGRELAYLDVAGLRTKLDLLVEMKLLEHDEHERYNVHPAVRDGFLAGLDAETSLRGHEAAREALKSSLGGLPAAGANPSDPATLDLLEEIVHHTLAAGHVEEAWRVYQDRIGGYRNLGWRLGAYERGDRICRTFARGRPSEEAPLPEGLPENYRAVFVNGWSLYLKNLGRLDGAVRCCERVVETTTRQRDWKNASIDNQNLTEVLLLAGRLTAASEAAEKAWRLAERAVHTEQLRDSYAYCGYVRALRGETSAALADFRDALRWQHENESKRDYPLYSIYGVQHTLLLARLGQNEEAMRLTEANLRALEPWGPDDPDKAQCKLVLADLFRQSQDLDTARRLLDAAHEWAIARDAKELLCWAAKVQAKIAIDAHDWKAARDAIEDGLRIARDCGFGLYHIDLMILRGRVALAEGDVEAAREDAEIALFRGVHPPEESGFPVLLAATDPECGYAWGKEDGRALLAEIEEVKKATAAKGSPSPQPSPPSTDLPKDEEASRGRGGRTRFAREGGGFDVFLCHNSQDKSAVEKIARTLQERGIRPWLDKWELRPGLPWQRALEEQIEKVGAAAVFVGANGIGPWQQVEHEAFLRQFVERQCPVIPVLLPGLAEKPRLPPFLAGFMWVDFNVTDPDPVDQLIWGITGEKPSSRVPTAE